MTHVARSPALLGGPVRVRFGAPWNGSLDVCPVCVVESLQLHKESILLWKQAVYSANLFFPSEPRSIARFSTYCTHVHVTGLPRSRLVPSPQCPSPVASSCGSSYRASRVQHTLFCHVMAPWMMRGLSPHAAVRATRPLLYLCISTARRQLPALEAHCGWNASKIQARRRSSRPRLPRH